MSLSLLYRQLPPTSDPDSKQSKGMPRACRTWHDAIPDDPAPMMHTRSMSAAPFLTIPPGTEMWAAAGGARRLSSVGATEPWSSGPGHRVPGHRDCVVGDAAAAGQPGQPTGQVPAAFAEQGHGGGHQHPAHHRGVDQDRRSHADAEHL